MIHIVLHATITQSIPIYLQWRIQDFPEEGAPTPQGGANIRICRFFPKTAWNWKNLDPQGGRASPAPPLRSATDLVIMMRDTIWKLLILRKETFVTYSWIFIAIDALSGLADLKGRGARDPSLWTGTYLIYRSGTVNSKCHLIRSYCEIFFYNFPNIPCLKYTVNSNFRLIRSKTLLTNDFELTVPDLCIKIRQYQ